MPKLRIPFSQPVKIHKRVCLLAGLYFKLVCCAKKTIFPTKPFTGIFRPVCADDSPHRNKKNNCTHHENT